MRICHSDKRTLAARRDHDGAVKGEFAVAKIDGDDISREIVADICAVVVIDSRDTLELSLLVARDDTRSDSSLDTAHAVGVWYRYAHGVLDEISADERGNLLGYPAEKSARRCGSVRDRDRLGASHGGNELLAENIQICGIEFTVHLFLFSFI